MSRSGRTGCVQVSPPLQLLTKGISFKMLQLYLSGHAGAARLAENVAHHNSLYPDMLP